MPSIHIPTPWSLERTIHALKLKPPQGEVIQRLDLSAYPGRALRAKGQSRAGDVSSSSTSVLNAFVYERADCRKMLVDGSAGGVVRGTLGSFGQQINSGCGGPAPGCSEPFSDPDVPCDPGENCAAAADTTGGPYDIDLNIASVLAGGAFSFVEHPGLERWVRGCSGAYDGQIYKPAKLRARVTNNTANCVLGLYRTNVQGLSCGAVLGFRGNGDSALTEIGNGASQSYFFFCLQAGAVFTIHIDHVVKGTGIPCGLWARLSGFRVSYRCAGNSPDSICDGSSANRTLTGCGACP